MKLIATLLVAAGLGFSVGCLLPRSAPIRDSLGQWFGRGHLVALVDSTHGIYEADLTEDENVADEIARENLRLRAKYEVAELTDTQRELGLLRAQFGSEKLFEEALRRSGISEAQLRERVNDELRARSWLAKQSIPAPSEQECRQFFETNREQFAQPIRFRAAHIFFAAPDGSPESVIAAKHAEANQANQQLAAGGDFTQIAAAVSEDEATKVRGGDLGFFSAERMPPEFVEQVAKLAVGATFGPIRSHLGFHILRLLETRPATDIPYDVARSEIVAKLTNAKRAEAVAHIRETLNEATYVRAGR